MTSFAEEGPALIQPHGCVSTQPALTSLAEAAGTPAIFRERPGSRHAPPAIWRAQPIAPSGHHGLMSGIADTPMRPPESLVHTADIVVAPLQK